MDTVTYPDPRVAHFIEAHGAPARVRVKEDRALVQEYLVAWTPNVVIADAEGRVHDRVEGFLPPEDFVARLAVGVGKYHLHRQEYDRAATRFEEVTRRHRGDDVAAEALYWLGVAQYKPAHDPALLRASWQELARDYPGSDWTRRSKVP